MSLCGVLIMVVNLSHMQKPATYHLFQTMQWHLGTRSILRHISRVVLSRSQSSRPIYFHSNPLDIIRCYPNVYASRSIDSSLCILYHISSIRPSTPHRIISLSKNDTLRNATGLFCVMHTQSHARSQMQGFALLSSPAFGLDIISTVRLQIESCIHFDVLGSRLSLRHPPAEDPRDLGRKRSDHADCLGPGCLACGWRYDWDNGWDDGRCVRREGHGAVVPHFVG